MATTFDVHAAHTASCDNWYLNDLRETRPRGHGNKIQNNPRSMAWTKKRLKIIIMEHRDSLSYLILSWLNPLLEVL